MTVVLHTRTIGHPARDQRGAIAILLAITLVVLFGFSALAVDKALMFEKRNRLSAAADGAAIMAAIEVFRNPSVSNTDLQIFAGQVATTHGFAPANVTLNRPPSSGPFAGNSQYVETFVEQVTPTFFANVWGIRSETPGARAVAGASSGTGCFITFESMTWGNNDDLSAEHCDVAIGGDLTLGNNSSIDAGATGVTGMVLQGRARVTNLVEGAPYPTDPLATLPAPSDPGGSCSGQLNVSSDMTINPGKYCGFRFDGKDNTLTLNAGIYYITGPIDARNPGSDVIISGTGVMIYLAPGGSIDLDSNFVDISISAPTSGTYKGIAFYQDRANFADAVLAKNNSTITINGAMYFPASHVTMKNNGLTANPCGLVVARTVTLKNNATFSLNNSCADFGGSPIRTVSLAE